MRPIGLLFAFISTVSVAHAGQEPLYQPAPAWVIEAPAIDLQRKDPGDPFILLFDNQHRVDAEGVAWSYLNQAIRMDTREVMQALGQIQIPWHPDLGDLIVHELSLLRGSERIDLLAQGQRFEVLQREAQLEQFHIDGMLTATLALQGLQVGDVILFRATTSRKDPSVPEHAMLMAPLLEDTVRAKVSRARLMWPKGRRFNWRSYVDGVQTTKGTEAGFDYVETTGRLPKRADLPEDAPPRFRPLGIIEGSTFDSWEQVSSALASLYRIDGLIAASTPLADEVTKIAAASSDPRVRSAMALRLVQDEVRYLYRGMDGGNLTPQTPAETWSRRYGDCKAKTLLLLAMLDALGVKAEPVAVHSVLGDHLPQRLPSVGAFDHILVRAEVGGEILWLDGTTVGTRVEDLTDAPTFFHALPVRSEGAGLVPIEPRANARPDFALAIRLDQRAGLSMPVPFTATLTVRGPLAGQIHAAELANKEQIKIELEGMFASFVRNPQISQRKVSYDPNSGLATIAFTGIASTGWKNTERRQRFLLDRSISERAFAPDRARVAWRDIPFLLPSRYRYAVQTEITLPNQGVGFALEGDQTLPALLGDTGMHRAVSFSGGVVRVEDQLDLLRREIAPSEIPSFRTGLAQLHARKLELVAPGAITPRWKEVMAARRQNLFGAIIAAYDAGVAADPESANAYENRAQFYRAVWEWDAAAKDYARAIELEASADLYWERSNLMRVQGRKDAALADAEAALALSPESVEVAIFLAERLFDADKRDAALAMLAERVAAGGKDKRAFVMAHADLLGRAGRVDEGVTALDSMIKEAPGQGDLLNARCWLKGTQNVDLEGALKDCSRAIETAYEPAAYYDSRAMVYYRMGRNEDALADLDAALEIEPDQVESLFLRGVVRTRLGDKGGKEDLEAARLIRPIIGAEFAEIGIKP